MIKSSDILSKNQQSTQESIILQNSGGRNQSQVKPRYTLLEIAKGGSPLSSMMG
jgi:hypothetical protein